MRNLFDIQDAPTTIAGVHDGEMRSHAILQMVVELLEKRTPPDVVLSIVKQAQSLPPLRYDDLINRP